MASRSTSRARPWLVLLGAAGLVALAAALRPYDPAPWLEDLATLERGAGEGFANLEWHVERGGVDPVALHRRTDSLIRHARSDREARAALRAFAAGFHDGHFAVVRPMPAAVRWVRDRWRGRGGAGAGPAANRSGAEACAALGYGDDAGDASALAAAPGYRAVDATGPFPTGIVSLGGRPVGVIRLATLGVDRFLPACARAWGRLRDSVARAGCDHRCASLIRVATGDELLADLRRRLRALREAGATALVVDLTGNGGGTEWADPAARQFSPRPLRAQVMGFVRHPHWVRALDAEAAELDSALAGGPDPALAPALRAARAALDTAIAEARQPCDRSALWTAGPAAVSCRQLVTGRRYVTGALPWLPDSLRQRPGAAALFWPSINRFEEGAWSGPLLLLVDRGTASAAEEFAVLLRDGDAARVVGERTFGAGCGMTNGGIPLVLPHSGLEVRMPDCARLRANGTNEVAGLDPDEAAGWAEGDGAAARATKALAAIGRALGGS